VVSNSFSYSQRGREFMKGQNGVITIQAGALMPVTSEVALLK
jgi:hypothetical protein